MIRIRLFVLLLLVAGCAEHFEKMEKQGKEFTKRNKVCLDGIQYYSMSGHYLAPVYYKARDEFYPKVKTCKEEL